MKQFSESVLQSRAAILKPRGVHSRWIWPVLTAILGFLALNLFRSYLTETNLYFLLLVILIVTNYWLPLWLSILNLIGMTLLFNFFFIPPLYTFEVYNHQQLLMLLFGGGVAASVSYLFYRLRLQSQINKRLADEANFLRLWNDQLHKDLLPGDQTQMLQKILSELTQRTICGFLIKDKIPTKDDMGAVIQWGTPDIEQRHALWHCMRFNKPLGRGTGNYEHFSDLYLPMRAQNEVVGAILISNFEDYEVTTRILLQTIIDQYALTLLHKRQQDAQRTLQVQGEQTHLKMQLLTAISHDYRTPLASIKLAVATLRESGLSLDAGESKKFLEIIQLEADRLIRVTTNLLQYTRLETASESIEMEAQTLEEVFGESLRVWRSRLEGARIQYQLQTELQCFRGNAHLMGLLVDNLIDNALKYSDTDSAICIRVLPMSDESKPQVSFQIINLGPPLPDKFREKLFAPFSRIEFNQKNLTQGAGVGLALCQAIVKLHGGELRYDYRASKREHVFEFICPEYRQKSVDAE